MSIEINKKDFEMALSNMKEDIENHLQTINDGFFNLIGLVITEYENHYSGDIEELISAHEILASEHQNLVSNHEDLAIERNDLLDKIEELEE